MIFDAVCRIRSVVVCVQVKALVMRGIFTLRRKELLWFYQEGASWLFPDAWEEYLKPIPLAERGWAALSRCLVCLLSMRVCFSDMMSAYYRKLTGTDEKEKVAAATAWSVW